MIKSYDKITPKIGKKVFVANSADIIGEIDIGDDSSVWFGCVIRGDVNYIHIGKRVNIQDMSMIHVTHASMENPEGNPTIIEDDVTIGHKVMLHGCSIVGANSLVTKGKIFPPRSLIMGTPAKVIRSLNDEEIEEIYNSSKRYVDYKNSYL